MTTKHLTKTLFKQACQCPRKLLYAAHDYPRNTSRDSYQKSLSEDGDKVGLYARLMYPQGIEIEDSTKSRTNLLSDDAVQRTQSALLDRKHEKVVLFEGTVQAGPYWIRADIMERSHGEDGKMEIRLLEVKAKSWDSSKSRHRQLQHSRTNAITSNYRPYIEDVAFQKWVLQQAFPDANVTAWLVLPDKAKQSMHRTSPQGMFEPKSLLSQSSANDDGEIDVTTIQTSWQFNSKRQEEHLEKDEYLLTEVNVDDLADQVLDGELNLRGNTTIRTFKQALSDWAELLTMDRETALASVSPPIGPHCKECEFRIQTSSSVEERSRSGFFECWQLGTQATTQDLLSKAPIVDLYYGGQSVADSLAKGKYFLSQLCPQDLGLTEDGHEVVESTKKKVPMEGISRHTRQWYQVLDNKSDNSPNYYLDREFLHKEMAKWKFPLHFLDFETVAPVLPYSAGKAPYQMLAFQFSHHVLHESGQVIHRTEFLHVAPEECPNPYFLEALQETIHGNSDGTIFRWGSHENTVVSSLLASCNKDFKALEALLYDRSRAMVDLMEIAKKGYYVRGSGGSSSLKRLLVPTMRYSKKLEETYGVPTYSSSNFTNMQWWQQDLKGDLLDPYDLLKGQMDGGIAHGEDAIVAFHMLQRNDINSEMKEGIKRSLLKYCELDTLAMVMIVQAWQEFLSTCE